MKKWVFTFIGSVLGFLLMGCASPQKTMEKFVGQPSVELLAYWGPPQHVFPDGKGGEVWMYVQEGQWTKPGQATTDLDATRDIHGKINATPNALSHNSSTQVRGSATTTYTPPHTGTYKSRRSFFIDSNGIVYRWVWNP